MQTQDRDEFRRLTEAGQNAICRIESNIDDYDVNTFRLVKYALKMLIANSRSNKAKPEPHVSKPLLRMPAGLGPGRYITGQIEPFDAYDTMIGNHRIIVTRVDQFGVHWRFAGKQKERTTPDADFRKMAILPIFEVA